VSGAAPGRPTTEQPESESASHFPVPCCSLFCSVPASALSCLLLACVALCCAVPWCGATWVPPRRCRSSEERGFFLRFVSLLINDSIYLLDDALEKIPRLREEEAVMADTASWHQLAVDERRTREEQFHRDQQVSQASKTLDSGSWELGAESWELKSW